MYGYYMLYINLLRALNGLLQEWTTPQILIKNFKPFSRKQVLSEEKEKSQNWL